MAEVSFEKFYNVINGELRGAAANYHGINPFTEDQLWPTPIATEQDLDDAVVAGCAAFQRWKCTAIEDRRMRVRDFAAAILAQKDQWSDLVWQEAGQPKGFAEGEIDSAIDWLTGLAQVDLPEYVTHEDDDVKVVTKYYPLGVVAAICPWNFPVFLASAKLASAVLTGNVVIIKPSPFTPYTALKLAELAQHFFPSGVVQALGGGDSLGPWMTTHPRIAKISFTGSTVTGKKIMAAAASTLKRVSLELGGNDACIICPDVDIDAIIPAIAEDAFSHGGQTCVAAKRIYVHSSIYDEFVGKFVMHCKELTPGQGFLSPVQNKMQYDKVTSIFDDCRDKQYQFGLGSADVTRKGPGFFIRPAIVLNPSDESRVVQEEPFGPIVPVLKWTEDDEVISRANATDQGLGATVWCQDSARAERIASQLEAGSIWVNRGAQPMPTALFGGVKESGIGGEWGPLGLQNYCDARTLHFSKSKLA